jgi:phage major head subunit gpT-like protein
MIINSAALAAARVGFQTSFQRGLGMTTSLQSRIATPVPSSAKIENYGWLGKMPNVREWVGDRLVQNLSEAKYSIVNKPYELTLGVDRDDFEDDTLGIYAPLFETMGESTASHEDRLVFGLLKAGFATNCFDDQFFFDTDHPVLDENGNPTVYANTDGGAGTPWFLLCTNKPLKPIILQKRKNWEFVARDNPNDSNVFAKKEFQYGSDARMNVGFGFPQMSWGSKQTLNAANYSIARAALGGMKADHGRPLGLVPNLLVVPPALESAGRKILNSEYAAGGETNEWKGTAELLVVPWLA